MRLRSAQRPVTIAVLAALALLALAGGAAAPGSGPRGGVPASAATALAGNHDVAAAAARDASSSCRRRARPLRIGISPARWPRVADHVRDVHRSRRWPRVWHIDRRGADQNREQAIDHWEDTRGDRFSASERRGKDRDEAPPAIARQGGLWRGRFADVRLVPSSENRSAGAFLGNRLDRWCNGQPFLLIGR